jgi:hypothetical protein
MATVVDPRTFEHPYLSLSELCFLFQLKRRQMRAHLARIRIEPARALTGEFFTTQRCSVFYAASEVLFALPPGSRAIFLAWQKGDFILPPLTKDGPAPLSALRMSPVGLRGGRQF